MNNPTDNPSGFGENLNNNSNSQGNSNKYNGKIDFFGDNSGLPPELQKSLNKWMILGIIQIATILMLCIPTFITGILTLIFIKKTIKYCKLHNDSRMNTYYILVRVTNIIGWGLLVVSLVFKLFKLIIKVSIGELFKLILGLFK